jgi:hypothetical protein
MTKGTVCWVLVLPVATPTAISRVQAIAQPMLYTA